MNFLKNFVAVGGARAAYITVPKSSSSLSSSCRVQLRASFSTTKMTGDRLKIAVIGQSKFAADVFKRVRARGHEVVGVFTVPDNPKTGAEDPVAVAAREAGVKVFKYKSWRRKGVALPQVLEEYRSVGAELNVMPYCSQFIPMEVIEHPERKSIVYHPSLLPRHRGASAISWTLIEGDTKGGFTIFWADEGLDTGPILLQRRCRVGANDTVDSLYNSFMYPEGVKAMEEAVELISDDLAPKVKQPERGATYDAFLNKPELCRVNLDQSAKKIHDFIRGLDSQPGAWIVLDEKTTKVFDSRLWSPRPLPEETKEVIVEGMKEPGLVHEGGLLLTGSDGRKVNIRLLQVEGKFTQAAKYGLASEAQVELDLTEEEQAVVESLRSIWSEILKSDIIDNDTDFFAAGAGSMHVVQLVEEVKERAAPANLSNEDVFLNTRFGDFVQAVILNRRGGGGSGGGTPLEFDAIKMHVNKMDISFGRQLYINGAFVDATSGKKLRLFNPHDESLICEVEAASAKDVDKAVKAAERAFYEGEWGKMSSRDRGNILLRLADIMDAHKEELATIESIDSGAVYTLALKTHVGMSVDTWRYFAGWCDKIEGSTIPISHARPNRNLTVTKREPVGVCALITPWNYPLMMLSWKMAACLAAGNTVIIKPAQVSPLTAIKFAELSHLAGVPPGVINVLPGSGSVCGQAMAEHPRIRKLGFTGSTEIGHTIMRTCADSNLKRVSLELGGKSPLIIFGDCDLDRAVKNALSGVFFNKGENCIAAGRLFVEEDIYEDFLDRVVEETRKMRIGDPLDRSTAHGPQNHRAHLEKLIEYCKRGVDEKARLLLGGNRVKGMSGLYMEPTIFADVEDHMFIAQEESFGPVMVVSKFNSGDVDEVIRRANDTEFGLASGVFTRDINKAMYVSEGLEAGTCFVNTYNKTDVAAPFGGCKQSGFGKDLGKEALNEYLKTKTITIEYGNN